MDAPPPARSASPLRNVRRCKPGSGPRPSRQDMPDGAGFSYSWLREGRAATLPPWSGSAAALSINGCSGVWSKVERDEPTNLAAAPDVCRPNLPWQRSMGAGDRCRGAHARAGELGPATAASPALVWASLGRHGTAGKRRATTEGEV